MQEKVINTDNFFPICVDRDGFLIPPDYTVVKRKKEPSNGVTLARKFGGKTKTKPRRFTF